MKIVIFACSCMVPLLLGGCASSALQIDSPTTIPTLISVLKDMRYERKVPVGSRVLETDLKAGTYWFYKTEGRSAYYVNDETPVERHVSGKLVMKNRGGLEVDMQTGFVYIWIEYVADEDSQFEFEAVGIAISEKKGNISHVRLESVSPGHKSLLEFVY